MTLFEFAVRHLRPLARIPGLAQLFDSGLLAWTSLFDRPRLAAMEAFEAAALALPGVKPRVHRLGGLGFAARGCEFAHLHGNGLLDVRVGREGARELIARGGAEPHHVFGPSAWISLWICSASDLPRASLVLQTAHAGLVTASEASEANVTTRIGTPNVAFAGFVRPADGA